MKFFFLSLLFVLLASGCNKDTPTAASPATSGAQSDTNSEQPTEPSIQELPEEGKLVKELLDVDAHVFAFSGTLLAVWLEAETKLDGEENKVRYLGPVTVTRRSIRNDPPASVRGKFIVFGKLMENPSLRVVYQSDSKGGGSSMGSAKPQLAPPWPSPFTGSDAVYKWECPAVLPEEGEEFLIASIHKTANAPAPTEQEPHKYKVIRETTLRIIGKRLPGAPEPAPDEQVAVTTLRSGGASVLLEGFNRGFFEGDPKSNAKKVTFHRNGLNKNAFEKSRKNLHLLEQLTKLEILSFQYTGIADDDLAKLKDLTNLQELNLRKTKVTGAGLKHITGLTSLRDLNLGDTEITDEGLDHLSDLSNLEVLNLGGTQVTDAGLEKLHGLTNLKRLSFSRSSVTDEGLSKIKKALPNCKVTP